MANINRSSIVGFHNIKNKVSRNAFDLSHRHMFTAQIGELLPIFTQWVNPNETFKLGYNGFTRTQPLQTAAFTRLRENVQYYFVPFQSLWKYFEQQVINMTSGQSGENISRIASSFSEDSKITTKLPYVNYSSLRDYIFELLQSESEKLFNFYSSNKSASYTDYAKYLEEQGLMPFGILRSASMAKLLRALGYINSDIDSYDIIANFMSYLSSSKSPSLADFRSSQLYGYGKTAEPGYTNLPNLSILPLLAYHKIVQDHYIYRQWQPYRSYLCNIDYLQPSDAMDFASKMGASPWLSDFFCIHQSNLPLDYFNGVLPKAQYGEEASATIQGGTSHSMSMLFSGSTSTPQKTAGALTSVSPVKDGPIDSDSGKLCVHTTQIYLDSPHTHVVTGNGTASFTVPNSSLKISALRSAIALQKYREIQESNDSDFASQVLAHFGVKPRHDDYKSVFIGGGDSVIDINPQVNQNLVDGNDPTIKATGAGQLSCGCKFTSDTYGIIIGIYRCVPQLDLAHVGIDRNLFKTDASDFALPELDNIGMQSQYRCEVVAPRCGYKLSKPSFQDSSSIDMATTYGYLPRYAELKTSYDRYEGAFLSSLSSWVTGYSSEALMRWMVPSSGRDYFGIDDLLQCRPSITNSIFVDQSAACVDNDKLLVGSVNSCVAIRPFSVYGLPYSN